MLNSSEIDLIRKRLVKVKADQAAETIKPKSMRNRVQDRHNRINTMSRWLKEEGVL